MLTRKNLRLFDALDIGVAEPGDLDLDEKTLSSLKTVVEWTNDYLCQPHPDLGRIGPVCPFTRSALLHRVFMLAVMKSPMSNLKEIMREADLYRKWFVELQGALHNNSTLATFVLVMPDADLDDPRPLDEVQAHLKDVFVAEGLMIGQFHPLCEKVGLWNENFYPLRCPVPLLAIRSMVPSDLAFLLSRREHFLAYLEQFAPAMPAVQRQLLFDKLESN